MDADLATIVGAAPEPKTPAVRIGRLKKFGDYDDPWGGDGTRLMPALRAIHKTGAVKVAEPPPPKGVSVKEWDKILQGKKKLAEDRPVAETEFQGLEIGIENPKGSVRSGVDRDGHEWHTKMKLPYGFIKGVKGKDGDSVDVFVGPDKGADKAFVVHQRTPDGKKYDEDKVFLGLHSKREAKEAFMAHNDNDKALGDVAEVSMERLQQLCEEKGKLTKISQATYVAFLEEAMKLASEAEQLRKGEKVEQEHEGTIEAIKREPDMPARKAERLIASDHVREIPDYYTRLAKMEKGAQIGTLKPPPAPGAVPPPNAAGVAGATPVPAGAAPRMKLAWSSEGFKEGLKDEGIPLSGATLGAALGAYAQHKGLPFTPLTGAALGYAGGSGASLLRSRLSGENKEPSTAQKVLALSGLGYGIGGTLHGGMSYLASRGMKAGTKPGMLRHILAPEHAEQLGHHLTGRGKALAALTEEGLPATGATLATGAALATDKSHQGHVVPRGERGAPVA